MRTRIVPVTFFEGSRFFEIHHRRWWWPFWKLSATVTSLRDAQAFAIDIRNGTLVP